MFPTNSTGLTLAGVLKWIAIVIGGVMLFQAYQGVVQQVGGGGRGGGILLTGPDAVRWGWMNVLYSAIAFAIAWALWFFWQRNED
jgi:hypothetical protein